jgi:hypothetical protein
MGQGERGARPLLAGAGLLLMVLGTVVIVVASRSFADLGAAPGVFLVILGTVLVLLAAAPGRVRVDIESRSVKVSVDPAALLDPNTQDPPEREMDDDASSQ